MGNVKSTQPTSYIEFYLSLNHIMMAGVWANGRIQSAFRTHDLPASTWEVVQFTQAYAFSP